jgi:hypothetical protein
VLFVILLLISNFSDGLIRSIRRNNVLNLPNIKQYLSESDMITPLNFKISQHTLESHLASVVQGICIENNTTMTLINLIKIGDEYNKEFTNSRNKDLNEYQYEEKNGFVRVNGCMATVLIKTIITGHTMLCIL